MSKRFFYRSIWVIGLLLAGLTTKAQDSSIYLNGVIVTQNTQQKLQSASVKILKKSDSSSIKETFTNNQGEFSVFIPKEDGLLLSISFIGYKSKIIPLQFKPQTYTLSLGTIQLTPASNQLKRVVVKGQRKRYIYKQDSIIFNVPENFEPGGNAKDVLAYTPSLTIDANDNIRIRGQGVAGIYVDGKPVSDLGYTAKEYLENTPAFMIERIEVLKTPPDPEDRAKAKAAGIVNKYYLNILTRRIHYRGYTAELTAGGNTRNEKTGRMHLNTNLKPFELNYSNNLSKNIDSSYRHRLSFIGPHDTSTLNQRDYNKNVTFNQNLQGRYTFKFSKKEQLRLQTNLGWNKQNNKSHNNSNIINPKDIPDQRRIQTNKAHSNQYNLSGNADYKKTYDKKGKELNASFNINQVNNKNKNVGLGAYLLKGDSLHQLNEGKTENTSLQGNIQYKNTFGADSSHFYLLNGSISGSNRHHLNDLSRSDTSLSSPILFKNNQLSSNSYSKSSSYGALLLIGKRDDKLGWLAGSYLSYHKRDFHDSYRGSKIKNNTLSIMTGLGINYSPNDQQEINLYFTPKVRKFQQRSRPNDSVKFFHQRYTDFIPGMSVKYRWQHHEFSFEYNRKIKQPSWNQLNPYINNRDPLNIKTGNPDLLPQSTNEFKILYDFNYKSFYCSLLFEDDIANNVISPYTFVDSNGVSTRTFVNLKERDKRAVNLNAGLHYFKNLTDWGASISANINGGVDAYQIISYDRHVSRDFHNVSGISEHLKIRTAFKISSFSLIIKGRYNGPRYFSQGKTPSQFRSGLQAQTSFFQHSLNLSLGIENLFGATVEDNFYKTDQYIQYSSNRRNVRYFSLYISYKFKRYKKLNNTLN